MKKIEDLFEVRHGEQLLNPGQEVAHQGLEGGVKTLIEDFLREKNQPMNAEP